MDVRLRRFEDGDAEAFVQAVRESLTTVGRWMPWCRPDYAVEDAFQWFSACRDGTTRRRAFEYGIYTPDGERLLGGVGINQIDWALQRCNLGYWVRERPAEVRANLALLQRSLQELGRKWLQPGQSLRIEVEQVDLAGRVEPALRFPQPLRVLRGGADWPRIDFKYTLSTAATGAQESGTASLSDQAYLLHPIAYTGEPLRYERRMLAQWFRHRFGERPAAAP